MNYILPLGLKLNIHLVVLIISIQYRLLLRAMNIFSVNRRQIYY